MNTNSIMKQFNPVKAKLSIHHKQLQKIKDHLREQSPTITEFNTWMREELNVPLRDRIIIIHMVEEDLDGFLNNIVKKGGDNQR